jgi:hypothetical protein
MASGDNRRITTALRIAHHILGSGLVGSKPAKE